MGCMSRLLTTVVMLMFLLLPSSNSQSLATGIDDGDKLCSDKPGRFGPDCFYKCHCALGPQNCNPNTGECTGPCSNGWFGPSCQYAVARLRYRLPWLPNKGDQNSEECNSGSTDTVTLTLLIPQPFTWLRAMLRNPDKKQKVSLFLWDSDWNQLDCNETLHLDPEGKHFDMACETSKLVDTVELIGELVLHLCNVFISAGRSLSQSEQVVKGYRRDGSLSQTTHLYNDSSCSACPEHHSKQVSYVMSFLSPVNVQWIKVFNLLCDPIHHVQEHQFELVMSSNETQQTSRFLSSTMYKRRKFYVLANRSVQSVVNISVFSSELDSTLSVCRLEVQGDYACAKGFYGPHCSMTCNCSGIGQLCHVAAGLCLKPRRKTQAAAQAKNTVLNLFGGVAITVSALGIILIISLTCRKMGRDEGSRRNRPRSITRDSSQSTTYEDIRLFVDKNLTPLETMPGSYHSLYTHLPRSRASPSGRVQVVTLAPTRSALAAPCGNDPNCSPEPDQNTVEKS